MQGDTSSFSRGTKRKTTMTQEQYYRAIQIHNRLDELQKVKKEIEGTAKHRLWYAENGSDWRLTTEWVMRCISKLLDKHDLMIRQEIEEEINNLKKEIETL